MDDKQRKDAKVAVKQTESIQARAAEIRIRKDDDLKPAAELLGNIKDAKKALKTRKEAITKPLNAALKEVRDQYKPAEDYLDTAEKTVKTAVLKFNQQQEARAAKKAAEIEQKVDEGTMDVADGMAAAGTIKQATTLAAADTGSKVSIKEGPRKIRITNAAELPVSYFLRPRVIEALRLEVTEDVIKNGAPVPAGAEVYRDKQVAGL